MQNPSHWPKSKPWLRWWSMFQPLSECNDLAHPLIKMESFALTKHHPDHEDPTHTFGPSFKGSSSPVLSCWRNHPTNSRPPCGLANTRICHLYSCVLGTCRNITQSTSIVSLPLLPSPIESLQALRDMANSPTLATDGEVYSWKGNRHVNLRIYGNRGTPAHAILRANSNYSFGWIIMANPRPYRNGLNIPGGRLRHLPRRPGEATRRYLVAPLDSKGQKTHSITQ